MGGVLTFKIHTPDNYGNSVRLSKGSSRRIILRQNLKHDTSTDLSSLVVVTPLIQLDSTSDEIKLEIGVIAQQSTGKSL